MFALLFLVGCTTNTNTITVYKDGSSEFIVDNRVKREILEDVLEIYENRNIEIKGDLPESIQDINVFFQETALAFNKFGFEVKAINEEDEVGFMARKVNDNIEGLNGDIKLLNELGLTTIDGSFGYKSNLISKKYIFEGTLSLKELDSLKEELSEYKDIEEFKEALSEITTEARIKIPGGELTEVSTYDDPTKELRLQTSTLRLEMLAILMGVLGVFAILASGLRARKK